MTFFVTTVPDRQFPDGYPLSNSRFYSLILLIKKKLANFPEVGSRGI